MPKIAALLAAAQLPEPEPVPTVTYKSAGRLLVIGPLEQAERAAAMVERRAGRDHVLAGRRRARRSAATRCSAGASTALDGLAGRFPARMDGRQPDRPGPVHALQRLRGRLPRRRHRPGLPDRHGRLQRHRACVKVCEAAGAIDFSARAQCAQRQLRPGAGPARAQPAFAQHAPPQGYFHCRTGQATCAHAAQAARAGGRVREAASSSSTSRSCARTAATRTVGCNACVEICSAEAIASEKARQQIKVNPNLCVGCGACTTVCPTGALTYAYPRAGEQGPKFRTLLSTYAQAGGKDAGAAAAQPGARPGAGRGTGPRRAAGPGARACRPT